MLIDDFFKILKIKQGAENEIFAEVQLNLQHKIFKGHFPGNPVVPGVVSIQMINEILSKHLGIKLMTSSALNIKFSAMISPNLHSVLQFKIIYIKLEDSSYKTNAIIHFEDLIFMKFNGNFKPLTFS